MAQLVVAGEEDGAAFEARAVARFLQEWTQGTSSCIF